MAAVLKIWPQIKKTPSVDAYLRKNIPAKFHPDPTWNAEPFSFLGRGLPNNNKKNNKFCSDVNYWSKKQIPVAKFSLLYALSIYNR